MLKTKVNGVEYPSVVAIHIPKYYLPKPHLQKQPYPESFVLQCTVDAAAVASAVAAYLHDEAATFDASGSRSSAIGNGPNINVVHVRIPSTASPDAALQLVLKHMDAMVHAAQSDDHAALRYILQRADMVALRPCDLKGSLFRGSNESMMAGSRGFTPSRRRRLSITTMPKIPEMRTTSFDPNRPLQEQLTMPFVARLSVSEQAAKNVLREQSLAELAQRAAHSAMIADRRDAALETLEEVRRNTDLQSIEWSLVRDDAFRRQLNSAVASREVEQWRKEKFIYEARAREARRRQELEAAARQEEAEWKETSAAFAKAFATAVHDEVDARKIVISDEEVARVQLVASARVAAEKLSKQSRVRAKLTALRLGSVQT